MNITDFIFLNSWYDLKYRDKSSGRYQTFKTALNLFVQNGGKTIVETGTTRMKDDWGAGMSTVLFADVASKIGGKVYTVDISPPNIEVCKEVTQEFAEIMSYHVEDSLKFLEKFDGKIDLLYLDSLDYPLTPEEGSVFDCQQHQLREYLLAKDKLHDKTIILLDDNDFPGGGKCKLTKDQLLEDGWRLLIDGQQSLWIK